MSFIVSLILIAVAWFFADIIDGIPTAWHLFDRLPLWLIGILGVSAIAVFISEP